MTTLKRKLRHIRYIDQTGYKYDKGGITISAEVYEDGTLHRVGVAKCHELDTFNRRMGRVKADGRSLGKFALHNATVFKTWETFVEHYQMQADQEASRMYFQRMAAAKMVKRVK